MLATVGRYSDSLRAGQSGDRIPVRSKFSVPVQAGPGAHPGSYTMHTGCSRSSRAISLHLCALMGGYRVNFTFYLAGDSLLLQSNKHCVRGWRIASFMKLNVNKSRVPRKPAVSVLIANCVNPLSHALTVSNIWEYLLAPNSM
jgi:hypothetical protein